MVDGFVKNEAQTDVFFFFFNFRVDEHNHKLLNILLT